MNKKIFIIIILAAVLALIAASVIFKKPRAEKITQPTIQEEKVLESQPAVEAMPIKESEPTEEKTVEKQVIKKEKPEANKHNAIVSPKTEKAATVENVVSEVKEAEIQKSEQAIEPSVIVDEKTGQIHILKEFQSQNSFKYRYTPVRFRKK